jgi:3',5'-cyclic-AMP phosphodiesterase
MDKSNSLVVAQITDTHLFATEDHDFFGLATNISLQHVLARLQQVQPYPDVLLMTGDLSQDETEESYLQLSNLVEPLGIPAYWLPGNHDRLPVISKVLQSQQISPQKSFSAGGWQIILLNSAIAERVYGGLSSESLEWLEQELQRSRDRPTLIALHHPPMLIDSEWMDKIGLRNPNDLFSILDAHPQVKLVLFGHIHQEFKGERQGVQYLGTPSTCIQFEPKCREMRLDETKPGFRLLVLAPDGSFTTRVERVDLA